MLQKLKNKFSQIKSEITYRVALIKHTPQQPKLIGSDRAIVEQLKSEGVYTTSLQDLGLDSTDSLLAKAQEQLEMMAATRHSRCVDCQIFTVADLPEFYSWALEPKLLRVIEGYIGLPVKFQGVHLRQDFPTPSHQFGIQRWHYDLEDRCMIKIIVYLNDVSTTYGPFEYIPKFLTSFWRLAGWRIAWQLRKPTFGIDDEAMKTIVPRSSWKSCPGKAGTVIFVDPAQVLHHGTPRSEKRSALFFVYTSASPQRPQECKQYHDQTYARPLSTAPNAYQSSIALGS